MKFEEFKPGVVFKTPAGKWLTVDITTLGWIIAFNIELSDRVTAPFDEQNNIIFYEYDFGGCEKLEGEWR
jgi:hypothetical protein